MEAVASRVIRLDKRVRAQDRRYEAWTIARHAGDQSTDIWFLVGRTWTRRGALSLLRHFRRECAKAALCSALEDLALEPLQRLGRYLV